MPDKKPSIEPQVSEAGDDSGKKPGWAFIEDGEAVTALSRTEMDRIVKEEESKAKEPEPEPESKPEPEAESAPESEPEPEVIEYDNEEDFLKAHGLFHKMMQSMEDVDREIQYRLQNISTLGGYDDHQELFLPTDSAEEKIEILRKSRKIENQLRRDQQSLARAKELRGEPESEPEKPKRPVDNLTAEEREDLADPTSEGYVAALDKYLSYRDAQNLSGLQRRLDRLEFEGESKGKELTTDEAKALMREKPYIRRLLADPDMTMQEKVDLLATMRDGTAVSGRENELRQEGRTSERRLQLKRNAQLRLTPGRATRRIPQPAQKAEEEFLRLLREGRDARKGDRRAKVAPTLKKLLEQSGA